LTPVALTSYVPHVIIVTNSLPAKTIPELIALSQKQQVSIATSGIGSATHMTLARFNAQTGAKLVHVPYRSGGSLLPDLISGHIQAAMTEFSTALPQHKGGKARIVGIAAVKRSKLAPEVPTMIEGGVKDFVASSYIGIVAPAHTPQDVVAKLQASVVKTLSGNSASAEKLRNMGSEIATADQMTPEGFGKFIHSEYEHSREAAKLAGLKPR
jgi:tripartite-type tricarboxylate transporter receptor subunit TctC